MSLEFANTIGSLSVSVRLLEDVIVTVLFSALSGGPAGKTPQEHRTKGRSAARKTRLLAIMARGAVSWANVVYPHFIVGESDSPTVLGF